MEITNIVGTVAGLAIMLGYLPQTLKTIKSRQTDDIAIGTFLLLALGSILFTVQGFLTDNMPLMITNALSSIMSSIIFVIKIQNDFGGRKK